MEKIKFTEITTRDKETYKVCPNCENEISPKLKHSYENEWCPSCGLNYAFVEKETSSKDLILINVRYGYEELYPKEEFKTSENSFHMSQIGSAVFETMMFFPAVGEEFKFEFGKEFEVEHDIIVGLPVYITISKAM